MSKLPQQRPGDVQPGQSKPQAPPPERKAKPKTPTTGWSAWLRCVISVLVVFHVLAVFSAPWFLGLPAPFALPPRDAQGRTIPLELVRPEQLFFERPVLVDNLWWFFRHYDNLLYINNGYEYFSPDPIWSTVLDYEIFKDGQLVTQGRFPDRREQWPRLFYHRHMMLVDQMLSRESEDSLGAAYRIADRLMDIHQGDAVRMTLKRHHLLHQHEVLDGKKLDDPSTYEMRRVIERRRGEPLPVRRVSERPAESVGIPGGAP